MFTPEQQLGIAALAGFLGAAYQFSHNKTDAASYNIAQRLFSMLVATFLCALLAYLFIMEWHWNWVLISICVLLLGTGAEWFIRLIMVSLGSAKTPEEFIDKVKKIKQAVSDTDTTPPPTPPTSEPPINDTNP